MVANPCVRVCVRGGHPIFIIILARKKQQLNSECVCVTPPPQYGQQRRSNDDDHQKPSYYITTTKWHRATHSIPEKVQQLPRIPLHTHMISCTVIILIDLIESVP